jgi:hypothetical protein
MILKSDQSVTTLYDFLWIIGREPPIESFVTKKGEESELRTISGNSSTVGYATTNDATTNECYNEQFLAIKSGCYNERGGILSADVARACA